VGGIGGELLLPGEGGFQSGEGGVEYVGQFAQLAIHVRGGNPLGEVPFGNVPGRGADVPNGAEGQSCKKPAAAQAEEQHKRSSPGQPPGRMLQPGQIGGDVAAHKNAIAHFGELIGLASGSAHAMADGGSGLR